MAAIQRASYALSFNLLNREGYSVLGIFNDNAGQTSTLEIINTSLRNLRLKNLEATVASADKHHFELKFRPGTLNPAAQITIVEGAAGWRLTKAISSDGCVSFYLLSTRPGVVEAGNITSIKLDKLNADSAGGARGTKVELKWKDRTLEYVADGSGNPQDLVAGHRVKHLDIVNLRGEQYIPLHVGFVGTNQVLNDGTTKNRLKLRITNTLKPGQGDITLLPKDPNAPATPPTELIFSFENSDKEWTLGSVTGIKINSRDEGKEFNSIPDKQATPPVWVLTPDDKKITLVPGGFVDITIEDVVTAQQAGPTNLYLHYRNIPGYWDGDFVSVIEKAPLLCAASKRVGIGVNDPQATLHVKGKVRAELLSGVSTAKTGTAEPGPTDGLHVVGDVLLGVRPSQIKCVSDDHRAIFNVDGFEIREKDSIVFSPGSDGKRTAATVMKADGKVGIGTGTNDPEAHLHVAGAGNQEIMIQSSDQNGCKWSLRSSSGASAGRFDIFNRTANESRLTILKDGKVGIGKTDPQAMLHVNGDVRVKEDGVVFFEDTGEIRSAYAAHRIMFRRKQNVLELREYGDIVFSPGSQPPNEAKETARVIMWADGTVGMGYLWKPADGNRAKMRATLDINDSVVTVAEKGYWFMNYDGTSHDHTFNRRPYSIWATARIACQEFNAVSDARLKNIRGRSDGATDLSTLLGIEVTDYSHKDVISKGDGAYKKLIGQQVEKVFPQAVTRSTDVVPDIYQRASIHDGWIALATDLKTGQRVRLITEQGTEALHEVLEVTEDKFRVDHEPEGEKVFVYGREVDDFLTVDYDAIAMLNVSATQQIKKEMDQELTALRVENAELRAVNDSLAKRLQLLESKLEAVVGVMSATNGSNGNARH